MNITETVRDCNYVYEIIVRNKGNEYLPAETLKMVTQITTKDTVASVSECDISLQYGVTKAEKDYLPPFPFINPAFILEKGSGEAYAVAEYQYRKLIVMAGYKESPIKIKVIKMKSVSKEGTTKNGVVVPQAVTFETDLYKLQNDIHEIEIPNKVVIFCGALIRPSISGSEDGEIRVTAQAKSAAVLFGNNPYAGMVRGTTSKDFSSILGLNSIDAKISETSSLVNMATTFPGILAKAGVFNYFAQHNISINHAKLDGVKRYYKEGELPKFAASKSNPMQYLNALCNHFGISYRIDVEADELLHTLDEKIVFFDAAKGITDLKNNLKIGKLSFIASDKENLKTASEINKSSYAVLMLYGEEVLTFSWSSTAAATQTGASATIAESSNNELTLAVVDESGLHWDYKIDKNAIEAWVEGQRALGKDDAGVLTTAIEYAKSNADAFIAYFITIMPQSNKKTPVAAKTGSGGITMNLKLKNPIPGLKVGSWIYFNSANPKRLTFPTYLIGFYKIKEVKNVLQPKDNLWVQTIDVIR